MRVLHILNELKPSGAEAMLHAAASYWHGQDIEGDILSTGNTVGTYASVLEKSGYRIYHIPFSSSYTFLLNIYSFLKKQHYDIIHIHPERANFWYALIAYISGNRKLIRTMHNVFPFKNMLRIERSIQRLIMRKAFDVKMVSISSSVKLTEWGNFCNYSILIPNWFDSTKYKPPSREERNVVRKTFDLPDDSMVITSIGGCWPYKNHSSIIKALAKLSENSSVVYLHVGQEAEGYPERKLAETIGVSKRVHFLGIVPDVLPILYASDVYIMPSLYEGFGVAAVEAMGAGLPAILSDVPGLRDFREVCKDIYWIEPTSESMAKALEHFLGLSAADLHGAGLRLSTSVHRHFAVENGARTYAQLYRGGELGT
jgi:glycosyltransferase involved in cell wall biosynthesis